MAAYPEVKIMSNYINSCSISVPYTHIEVDGEPVEYDFLPSLFLVNSICRGNELMINILNTNKNFIFQIGENSKWFYFSRNMLAFNKINDNLKVKFSFVTPSGSKLSLVDEKYPSKFFIGNKWKFKGNDIVEENSKFTEKIMANYGCSDFDVPLCEVLLNKKYFNGIDNMFRSTILYHLNVNPFQSLNDLLQSEYVFTFLELCKSVLINYYTIVTEDSNIMDVTNYLKQLRITNLIYYEKGVAAKDKTKFWFWFEPKWLEFSPYKKIIKATK